MSDYQLEIKQIVDYPRCRVYREFVQSLISDRNIRTKTEAPVFFITPFFVPMPTSGPRTEDWTASATLCTPASGSVACLNWLSVCVCALAVKHSRFSKSSKNKTSSSIAF